MHFQLRVAFEAFSKRVADCEVAVRGGKSQNIVRVFFSNFRYFWFSERWALSGSTLGQSNGGENRLWNAGGEQEDTRTDGWIAEVRARLRRGFTAMRWGKLNILYSKIECFFQIYIAEYDRAAAAKTLPDSLMNLKNDILGNINQIYEFHRELVFSL